VHEQERGVNVMRWSGRSAVVLLTGITAAVFGVAGVGGADVVPARVLPPPMADRLDGLAAMASASMTAELNGVFCTSSANCWAVGQQTPSGGAAGINQVLHWGGSKWRPVTVPEPGGSAKGDSNTLGSVRCWNARDCWAVRLLH
jgi:hypothetical protein